jgi:hypothetical protein
MSSTTSSTPTPAAPTYSSDSMSLPAERRALLRGMFGLAAGAAGAAVLSAANAIPVAASTGLPIRIDATQLVYRSFTIPGQTDWISARGVQSLTLAPGQYSFQVASGYFADFTFVVTPQGTIDYDPRFAPFLSGRGTSTLVIVGLPVTLDARYLSGSGVLLVVPSTNEDWITFKQCRMVPASSYSVQQGSGEVTSFTFKLGLDGRFTYEAVHDVAHGGFLAGPGTSALEFLGYPLLVDARAAGGTGVTIQPISGMLFGPTSVEYAVLLPAANFNVQVRSGVVSAARFSLAADGTFTIDPSSTSLLGLDIFHGLRRLSVLRPVT